MVDSSLYHKTRAIASSASSSPGGVILQGRLTGWPATPITIVGASGVSKEEK